MASGSISSKPSSSSEGPTFPRRPPAKRRRMMDIFDSSSEEGSDNEVQVISQPAQNNVVVQESQETLLATQSQIPMVAKQQTPMPIKKRAVYGGNNPGGGIPSVIHAADTPGSVGMESMTQSTFTTDKAPEEITTFLVDLDTAKTTTARVSLSPEKTSLLFTKAPPRKRSTKQPMSALEAIGSQAPSNLLSTLEKDSRNMTAEALRAYEESKERVVMQMDVKIAKSKPAGNLSGDSAVTEEEEIQPPKQNEPKTIEKCVEKPTNKEATKPIDKPKKSTKETKQEMQALKEKPTTKEKTKGKQTAGILPQTIDMESKAGDKFKTPPEAAETCSPKVGKRTAKARAVKAKTVDKEITEATNVGVKALKPAAPVKNTFTTNNDEATSRKKLAVEEVSKQSTAATVKIPRTSVTNAEAAPKATTTAVLEPKVASAKSAEETTAPKSAKGPPKKEKKRTFQDQVLAEMFFSCKPYTLKTLSQALQTTEAALNHVMLSLLDKQIVVKKEFSSSGGRSKELYWANQESKAKQIQGLLVSPQEISAAREELQGVQRQELEIQKQMAILTLELSNQEIDSQLQAMERSLAALKTSIVDIHNRIKSAKLQPKNVGLVPNKKTPAQLAKECCPRRIKIRINHMRDEWKKRKDKCMDFIDQLADGMEKKPKDVAKLLDLETDEMEGVVMPAKHEID